MKFEAAVVLFLGTIAQAVPRAMVVSEGNTYLRDLEIKNEIASGTGGSAPEWVARPKGVKIPPSGPSKKHN
ncbi:hypothetical protein CGMCC3_g9144 [Colletotrichum fructicola]|nr:uncharacterized protein CGMCC3_g9144 [Colletotrichum fructicola]KAE9574548.1 hypothetical protein CGMCC3_g9144 [Colletotrichum fructicola]